MPNLEDLPSARAMLVHPPPTLNPVVLDFPRLARLEVDDRLSHVTTILERLRAPNIHRISVDIY